MNKLFALLLSVLLLLSGCKDEKEPNIILDQTIVNNCRGKALKLYLPSGFGIPDRVEDYTGFFQTYIFSDKSCVTIMCDSTSELSIAKVKKEDLFSRREVYNGFEMIYWNVKQERKEEFDYAFEKMKSEKPVGQNVSYEK